MNPQMLAVIALIGTGVFVYDKLTTSDHRREDRPKSRSPYTLYFRDGRRNQAMTFGTSAAANAYVRDRLVSRSGRVRPHILKDATGKTVSTDLDWTTGL